MNKKSMKLISSYIPIEFYEQKVKTGFSWRLIIAKGLNSLDKIKELESEMSYYVERVRELNTEKRNLIRQKEILNNLLQKQKE